MKKKPNSFKRFLAWMRSTLDMLCERPDHLQRLALTGAGLSLYPMMISLVAILVWFGINGGVAALAVIPWFGWALMGMITAFILVAISLLGTIKGVKLAAPGGASIELDMVDEDSHAEKHDA